MNGLPRLRRPWLSAVALAAALALVIKGAQELQGAGWSYFVVAGAIVAAVLLRQFFFRG